MRLLAHLLVSGDLPRSHLQFYLAYTAIIHDFYAKHEWGSILDFDYHYREQHAAHVTWSTINPVMELQLLVPWNQAFPPAQRPGRPRVPPGLQPQAGAPQTTADCRQWLATGFCRFGSECRNQYAPLPPLRPRSQVLGEPPKKRSDIAAEPWYLPMVNTEGWWWWYHSLTAHQHQKGHTVPKQVIMVATSIQVATV